MIAFRHIYTSMAALASSLLLQGQATLQTEGEEPIVLSEFTVSGSTPHGYRASNSISGTRVNTPLRQLPQQISVVTEELIDDLGAFNLDDALRFTSGVTRFGSQEARFNLRGFTVGVTKRDGFEITVNAIHEAAFFDRIEVVKGPAALLYGVTEPGGLVNAISKRPAAKRSTTIRQVFGTNATFRTEIDTTGTAAETALGPLLYRVVAVFEDSDGFRDFTHRDRWGIEPALTLQLSPETSLTTSFRVLVHDETEGSPESFANFTQTALLPNIPREFNAYGPDTYRKIWEYTFQAEITHRFSKSWAGRVAALYYQGDQRFLRRNGSRETAPGSGLVKINPLLRDYSNQSPQIHTDLSGKIPLGAVRLEPLLGYQYEQTHTPELRLVNPGIPPFNVYAPQSSDYAVGNYPVDFVLQERSLNRAESHAVFAFANLVSFSERLRLMGGIRHQQRSSNFTDYRSDSFVRHEDQQFTTPQAGISVRLSDSITGYALYSESIRPNSNRYPNDPQKGIGYEGGFKFDFLSGRLSGTANLFEITLQNIERTDFSIPSWPTSLSGKERSRGSELEIYIFPTDAWQILTNYAYTDARVVSDREAPQLESVPLASASRHNFNLWTKYTFQTGPLTRFFVGAGFTKRSEYRPYFDANRYRIIIPGYHKFDASLGYTTTWKGRAIKLQLNINNVTDRTYIDKQTLYAEPRTLLGTVELRF